MADIKIMDVIPKKIDIAYDSRQWILRRYGGVAKKTGEDTWNATKFVTGRVTMFSALMQMGVGKQLAAETAGKFPTTHSEWMAGRLDEA